ncbi:MAG: helix-turn-helix transcriptional regulator [Bacteroidota bacterium]
MTEQSLSERLKAARLKLGFTQAQAAEAWHINRRTLENWESEKSSPTAFALHQINTILNEVLDES